MDLTEITKIVEEAGLSVCPICGIPFKKYHSRQRTCGAPDCKRVCHNQYLKEHREKLKAENPEVYNKKKADANRKWRAKRKAIEGREEQLLDLQDHWKKQSDFDKFVTEHGHEYGKYSAEKVLAMVPKIDVSLDKK